MPTQLFKPRSFDDQNGYDRTFTAYEDYGDYLELTLAGGARRCFAGIHDLRDIRFLIEKDESEGLAWERKHQEQDDKDQALKRQIHYKQQAIF